ncbi:putative bifunctional diguanylate cyclase/phosphodiesterase [Sphingomonas dokdonensis]|uniref:Phytochrome-like protein cph2 n=1 Tax=Sphingomonas dokdonensis TaxID=344880 RepID=A0A245ZMY9_9SPHN|nr:EAL domain-containing protein [Sphingomonas dokdonensis]OWK31108.1 phytochrome-like protein cph2 [Sphingomonas dokdonensis]
MPILLGQLLGIRDGDDPVFWGRLRATQLFAGRRLAPFVLAANLFGGVAVVALFGDRVPALWLAGWFAGLTVVAAVVALRRLRTAHLAEGAASLQDLRDTALEGLALATMWSFPPLVFAALTPGSTFNLWMILAVLMAAAALAMAPLVLAALAFIGGVTFAAALLLALEQQWLAAGATLALGGLMAATCLARARVLLALRAFEMNLSDSHETVSLLLGEFEDSGADWLWETDSQRRLCKVTPRLAHALGSTPERLEGMPVLQALAGASWETGDFAPALRLLADKLKRREAFRDLSLPLVVNGEQRWWEITANPRLDDRGQYVGFRGVGSDVTEQRASADKINRMARFDALTGLPNRLFVNEALGRALAEAERWGTRAAFMMIDLDRFKAVNDTLGHPIGDRLLGRVSERLAELITDNELIGRLGGDEFAVVMNDATDASRVERLAQRIIETLSRPYEVDQHTLYIGASVGVATSPRDGRTAETLVRSADLALYRSKDAGGGVFHAYEPQLHVDAEERRVLEMALRKALEKGELHLDYQPVVDAGSERLVGFEALLRWNSPEHGPISPAKFIPIAEETRLIGPIGEWVVRTACAEAAGWPEDVRVAVNVSPEQLHNPNFASVVAKSLSASGLAPHRLELEVTESVFMREATGAVQALERMLELGVRLSLDDFGTGYSSLGYLSRTRFSTIKIDRSFVTSASRGVPEALAIIRAVVALANSLGMATTAEGVETADELALTRMLGCSKIQGYHFGRPLPVAEARAIALHTKTAIRAA